MHHAMATTRPVEATGLGVGRRWPTVGMKALELGVHGVIGVPVSVDGEPVGAAVARENASGRLRMSALHPSVQRVLEMTALLDWFPFDTYGADSTTDGPTASPST